MENISPVGRVGGSGVYDEKRNRMVFFGGKHAECTLDDTWEMSFSRHHTSWREIKLVNTSKPISRCYHTSMYYPDKNIMLVWGGYHIGRERDRVLDDLWCFDLDSDKWYEIDQSISMPKKRCFHGAVLSIKDSKMFIFGGTKTLTRDSNQVYGDIWSLDLNAFSKSKMKANRLELPWEQYLFRQYTPQPRYGHLLVYSTVHECILMFGGFGGTKPFTDLWKFTPLRGWESLVYCDLAREEDLNTENTAYCIHRNHIYIYSGGIHPSRSLWVLDLSTLANPKWYSVQFNSKRTLPWKHAPRWKSTFVYNHSTHELILFSGSLGLKYEVTSSSSSSGTASTRTYQTDSILSDCTLLDLNKIEK